ncbi:MAG: GPI transamidase component PIG-S [Lasallia pustulata]|uniref:GPI transamidase component PIG-S n=1 Tax=Lasallia pustulata TaxID=136370 RepID=A0A5M8PEW7_9LECA|nr:MAG: GPI transamidase component PIG-S [Lasallia pustulata]
MAPQPTEGISAVATTMGDGGLEGEGGAARPGPPVDTPVPKDGNVIVSKKSPPPESSTSIYTRSLVIISFWLVVVCLGLPTWWWTTSIYRARLPLQEMLEWADGKACKPVFPLQIVIDAPSLQDSEAQHLVRTTQHALDDLNEFSAHHLRLRLAETLVPANGTSAAGSYSGRADTVISAEHIAAQEEAALTVRLFPAESAPTARAHLGPHSTTLDVFYPPNQIPSTSSSSSALANFIATQLQSIFAEEQATIAYILTSSQLSSSSPSTSGGLGQPPQISQSVASSPRESRTGLSRVLPPDLAARLNRQMTRALKYAPTYHLTISLFSPTASPSTWDIEAAIDEYFTPLLESFSTISNFTVDTQVQLYATFSPSVQQPEYSEEQGVWTLRNEDLSGFINAAEWPLSPSIGAGPTLNFVLYVPSRATAPLVVKDSLASSWLIPQWGGVMILNPSTVDAEAAAIPSTLSKEAIQPALFTFSHQLLSLLGTPQSPPSLPLRLQTLTRVRAASLLLSASSTMGSLARLTVALPSIAIPETVAAAVEKTISHLRNTCTDLRDGRFQDALENSRIAEAEAEKGFFEKSMVGQVYFPDEHKVAVYLPLLGPVGVPLVMAASKETRRMWTNWKQRKHGG